MGHKIRPKLKINLYKNGAKTTFRQYYPEMVDKLTGRSIASKYNISKNNYYDNHIDQKT